VPGGGGPGGGGGTYASGWGERSGRPWGGVTNLPGWVGRCSYYQGDTRVANHEKGGWGASVAQEGGGARATKISRWVSVSVRAVRGTSCPKNEVSTYGVRVCGWTLNPDADGGETRKISEWVARPGMNGTV